MTDIEIARNTKLEKIIDVAKKIEIDEENIEQYGKYKAKISSEVYEKLKTKKDGYIIYYYFKKFKHPFSPYLYFPPLMFHIP